MAQAPGFDALDQLMHGIATISTCACDEVLLHTDLQTARRAFRLRSACWSRQRAVCFCAPAAWFARKLAVLPFDFEIHTPVQLRNELTIRAARLQARAKD